MAASFTSQSSLTTAQTHENDLDVYASYGADLYSQSASQTQHTAFGHPSGYVGGSWDAPAFNDELYAQLFNGATSQHAGTTSFGMSHQGLDPRLSVAESNSHNLVQHTSSPHHQQLPFQHGVSYIGSSAGVEITEGARMIRDCRSTTANTGPFEYAGLPAPPFPVVAVHASPPAPSPFGPAFELAPQRPPAQPRSKSHTVADIFGMMGPPPRPLVRSQSASNSNPSFGSPTTCGSPQQSTSPTAATPVYQSYRASPFAPPPQHQANTLSSSPQGVGRKPEANMFLKHSHSSHAPVVTKNPPSDLSAFPKMDAVLKGTWASAYRSSELDLARVLSRVTSRPNPQLVLGPVDSGCSFLVVDARKADQPIVFASETFSRLTGYSSEETLGRNCRFMQAPDGLVVQGEKRKYTDGNAAYHIRRHMLMGKESQASMINYCKGGRPFINLITVIPITWDSDEIAFYVGFQVDLVEQPSAITDKLKNGSYAIDYRKSSLIRELSATSTEPISTDLPDEVLLGGRQAPAPFPSGPSIEPVEALPNIDLELIKPEVILDQVNGKGPSGLKTEAGRKTFNRMLLENCDDFVHVLSLKGSLLYVSPSSKRLLEYDPTALVGKSLGSYCHPSDIVSVLRELKEAGSSQNASVDLVFRFRRKNSGYTWIEAHGKLHLEQGKGRKCVILVGRVRHVYKMSWYDLERTGGFGKQEYWSKMSTSGTLLYATPTITQVLGYQAQDLTGKTYAELSPAADIPALLKALALAASGKPSSARHRLLNKAGIAIDVVTHFYPSRSQTDGESASPLLQGMAEESATVIAQTNLAASEVAKIANPLLPSAPSAMSRAMAAGNSRPMLGSHLSGDSGASSSNDSSVGSTTSSLLTLPSFNMSARGSQDSASTSGTSAGRSVTSFSAITSTYKVLENTSNHSDNIFDELDSVRGTSWQFELHQMRLTNRKLREEKEALVILQRKKLRNKAGSQRSHSSSAASAEGSVKSCLNCGKTQSAEWRTGPTGPKTLCNACGLRWSKARSQSINGGSSKVAAVPVKPKSISISPAANYPTPSISETPSVSPRWYGSTPDPFVHGQKRQKMTPEESPHATSRPLLTPSSSFTRS